MAPKKCKKNKTKKGNSTTSSSNDIGSSSSSSPFCLEVSNTPLPQVLHGGPYQTNPYQFDGPRNAFEAKTVKEGFYVRVDMPGVEKDLVEVNFEDNKLSFSGKAPQITPYESGPRNYHGVIKFSCESVEVSEIKLETNDGVLRMVLVGSGFPPDFYAASTHFKRRRITDHFESMELLTSAMNQMMVSVEKFVLFDQPVKYVGMYPFQVDGAKGTYEIRGMGSYCFYRLDMPDVGTEGLTLRMKDRCVSYGGTGVKASEYDESKRLYAGNFAMECPCACSLVDMHGDITDGVLRLLIKKEKDEPTERTGNTCSSEAGSRS
ncbi:hypothetical protein LIER_25253 [Lithospermum erythrorhizon]|uniref:SHSP domain-containing protein n=1 Tax=Lithospermum erythrorhizon TaxID=34254 RepID=A0AAV3R435_LITER